MRHRTVASAERPCVADRLGDVPLGRPDRVDHVETVGQASGNGRRKGAAGAVGVGRVYAFSGESVERLSVKEQISGVTRAMTTLHDHGTRAKAKNVAGGLANVILGFERSTDQHFGL